jgi:Family of unknown function (DUF6527)
MTAYSDMPRLSAKLLQVADGIVAHWCPACERHHHIWIGRPQDWSFDGNLEAPTFSPSVKVTYDGRDAGQPGAPAACCHYFLHVGYLSFCADSTHKLAGKTVPLPDLPDGL